MATRLPAGTRGGAPLDNSPVETVSPADSVAEIGCGRALIVIDGDRVRRQLLPASGVIVVGRDELCAVIIKDQTVSRRHLEIAIGTEVLVKDLATKNGTHLMGAQMTPRAPHILRPNEPILIGRGGTTLRWVPVNNEASSWLVGLDELRVHLQQLDRRSNEGDTLCVPVLLRARVEKAEEVPWLERVLGSILSSPADRLVRETATSVLMLVELRPALPHFAALKRSIDERLSLLQASCVTEHVALREPGLWQSLLGESVPSSAGTRSRFVLRDPAMQALQALIARIAPTPVNVLILGETGVGKDVMAALLHEISPRRGHPFVRVNCAALPEALLESELFGYERGAFTGAASSKVGLLEHAEGGTVFLDEIGEMPLALQAKLLRAIETKEISRLGSVKARIVEIRFIAATNRDLQAAVAAKQFRSDLLFRLNTVTLTVPPLRERLLDIEPLAIHFADVASRQFGLPTCVISPAALDNLRAHPWPGNVRELRNVIERAVIMAGDGTIRPEQLELNGSPDPRNAALVKAAAEADTAGLGTTDHERAKILEALTECGGNQTRAAKLLGIPRRTFVRRLGELDLPRPRRRPEEERD